MTYPEKLRLANLPTPIVKLERLSRRIGKNIWLWRDDLTGCVESGNKIRKLEYLLAEAVKQKATQLITCGGPQSNHARATVCLGRRLGIPVTVLVREPQNGLDMHPAPTGNLLLNHIFGATVKLIPFSEYQRCGSSYTDFLSAESEESRSRGETPYAIPEGGSSPLGAFGYINAVKELIHVWCEQGPGSKAPDSLFCALGSGGTLAGLVLGYIEQGLSSKALYAVNVCDSAAYFKDRVGKLLEDTAYRYNLRLQPEPLNIFDGHFGRGYALTEAEDFLFYAELAREEGVILDPVYTGKAFRGMLIELEKEPERFGENILFLHSGGIFGTFAYADQYKAALRL